MGAAYDLIWEYSYGAVTIDAICARAKVKKGSFYYFFDSKSELASAAIEAWWGERHALLKELFQREVPPIERLRRYLDFVAQRQLKAQAASGHVMGCPLFTLGAEISTQDERIRAQLHRITGIVIDYFTCAIAAGQANGEIAGGDPKAKARVLFCFYEGVLTQARIENHLESIRTLSRDALALIGAREAPAAAAA